MEPAKHIIDLIGGPAAIAVVTGVHRTRPYEWLRSGTIPLRHAAKIIAAAKAKRKRLTLDDFLASGMAEAS
jgi:hypothetical protein